jgi:uncharacterized membrane protein
MRDARPIAVLRDLYAGRRLVLCIALGAAVFLALPAGVAPPLKIALAWVAGVWLFLGLTALAVGDASPARLRQRAQQQDERAWVISALIVAAAGVSLLALGMLLRKGEGASLGETVLRTALAGFTVVGSWLLTHTMFALHYAHRYYGGEDEPTPAAAGLDFPGKTPPDYWDFFYFSLVIGMTSQVSDVQVTSRPMRRLALVHGILSFFFNTVILALTVNFLASVFS